MATKNLWQSVTGWMTKSDEPSAAREQSEPAMPQQSEPAAYPGAAPSAGSDSGESRRQTQVSTALPITPSRPSGAPARPAAGESAQPAVDPDPRPDEGLEINRKIIDVIKTCYDPEIPVNIYELGLIYGVNVNDEGHAHVTMTLTAPNCPAAQSLPNEVKFKVEAMDEIKSANVEIVFDPTWTPNRMSDAAKLTLNIL
jgi:FeS assembly SUF system protein